MKRSELSAIRAEFFQQQKFKIMHHSEFDFSILKKLLYITRTGGGSHDTYNDCIIALDTETSKKTHAEIAQNHLCAWSICVRAFHQNLFVLYGHRPSSLVSTIGKMLDHLPGQKTIAYIHNLTYDWTFCRQYLMEQFGTPVKQLNTKSHYPIYIEFANGLILRDSLILAQRKLEKWAKDLNVEHQKAVGSWDYDKIRNQRDLFSADELTYIANDVIALCECIDATMQTLNKRIYSMPWTATGIPREEMRKRGRPNHAHDRFLKQSLTAEKQLMAEKVYHGGYTHGNRYFYNEVIEGEIKAYDFASSYPFVMLSEQYPCEKFTGMPDCCMQDIIDDIENAYMFKLIMIRPDLKDYMQPMPALQFSKCVKTINPVIDNGRILCADYVEIYLTDVDLRVIDDQYHCEKHLCCEVLAAAKAYLPRWITDYVYELFEAKTKLKGGDSVLYFIAKAKLNSLYGLFAQRPVRKMIIEDYKTGEYYNEDENFTELYEKYVKRFSSILPYQIGIYVTAYAFYNLFQLGKCAGSWIYSDTDSAYGLDWNEGAISSYNENCREKLRRNGYTGVLHNGQEYWPGVAELDGIYSQFKCVGAKRYCVRADDGLHITVAGVPKAGVKCLNDDINNFRKGLIFSGSVTGKKQYTYFFQDAGIDENGNETADSIDLSPCDYLLDDVFINWDLLVLNETEVRVYD